MTAESRSRDLSPSCPPLVQVPLEPDEQATELVRLPELCERVGNGVLVARP